MTDHDTFTCDSCLVGTVRPVAKPGRTDKIFGTGLRYPIPDDLVIPTCDRCGDSYTDEAIGEALDAACRASWIEQVTALIRQEQAFAQREDQCKEPLSLPQWDALVAFLPTMYDAGVRAEVTACYDPMGGVNLSLYRLSRHGYPSKALLGISDEVRLVVTLIPSQRAQSPHNVPVSDCAALLERLRGFMRGDR